MTQSNYNASIDPKTGLTIQPPERPPEYKPFPVDLLPEPLRSLVTEGADSLQCDPVLIVLPMLTTIGAAIGNARHLVCKEGWSVAPCLWTMFIAESGSVKTPAFSLAKRPLEDIERDSNDRYDAEAKQYESALAEYDETIKAWRKSKKGDKPNAPTLPIPKRFIVKDTTLAGLTEILRHNPRGLLIPMDELAGWFGAFNKFDSGNGDAQKWISIYSGEPISNDRKGNVNEHKVMLGVKVYRPFAGITGAIQPGIWHKVLTPEHQATGMAARYLMAWPPRRAKKFTDNTVSPSTLAQYATLIQSLVGLDHDLTDAGHYQPRYVGMGHDAKRLYREYYNRHNVDHLDRNGSLAAASAKIEETPLRLGLILHCTRLAMGEISHDQLDADTMAAAITISDWFMDEAERIYSVMATESTTRPDRELADWIRLRGGSITPSELVAGKRKVKNVAQAEGMLTDMASGGWGEWQEVPPTSRGGRPTRRFVLSAPSVVSETPSNPEQKVGFTDADTVDVEKTRPAPRTKRVAI